MIARPVTARTANGMLLHTLEATRELIRVQNDVHNQLYSLLDTLHTRPIKQLQDVADLTQAMGTITQTIELLRAADQAVAVLVEAMRVEQSHSVDGTGSVLEEVIAQRQGLYEQALSAVTAVLPSLLTAQDVVYALDNTATDDTATDDTAADSGSALDTPPATPTGTDSTVEHADPDAPPAG